MTIRLTLLSVALLAAPAAAQNAVVVRNVTAIPMTGSPPAATQTVVVRDGRITRVGPSAGLAEPDDARVIR